MVDTAGGDIKRWARSKLGSIIKGKYRLDDVIGVGGMAVVFKATHRNQAEFAVKMLLPELSFRQDLKQRFLREGYAANSVKHAGVVRVVDDDVADDGAAFLVMDLLQGEGVEALWARYNHRLPATAAVGIVEQLLDVLAAAHAKNIIHRDIKPANLFLSADGTLMVLDFGIARVKDAMASGAQGANTHTGMLLGTPAFMAPEQAKALTSEIDARTDIWAAGATLFTLMCGEFVHKGETAALLLINSATTVARPITSVVSSVPLPIAAVTDKALAFEKSQRWQEASAMRDALREAHRAVYGTPPSRELIVSSLANPSPASSAPLLTQQTVRLTPASPAPIQSTGPSPQSVGATTAQPVSSRDAPALPKRSLVPLVVAAGVLGAAAVIGVSVKVMSGRATTPSLSAQAASAPASFSPPTFTTTVVRVEPAPSANAAVSTSTTPTSTVATASHQAVTASVNPTVKPTVSASVSAPFGPATTAKKAAPGCDPPFTIDSAGRKLFKKECL